MPLYRMPSAYESYRSAGFSGHAIKETLTRKYSGNLGDEPFNDFSQVCM